MKIEIIMTGDELMCGLTIDTNFRWVAERLSGLGFDIKYHTTVGDDKDAIFEALRISQQRSQAVIVSGGLGPTPDDLTAEVASRFFEVPLELNEMALGILEKRFRERGMELLEINKKQAYIPKGSKILENLWGTAPGFQSDKGNTVFFFLPGVPKEFRAMVEGYVLPELRRRNGARIIRSKLIKTFGLRESEVAQELRGLENNHVTLGYRSHYPEIHLRITVHSETDEEINRLLTDYEKEIAMRLGDYVFSTEGEELEEVVGNLLRLKKYTIALAESCTGGLMANRITNVPGSSDYFERGVISYSNRSKEEILGVPSSLIESKGAVSAEVVESMAEGVRILSNAELGIGISGIAGPGGGSADKPVGTVYVGISSKQGGTFSRRFQFSGTREEIKLISSEVALDLVRKFLLNDV